jgi:hypothetical protein
MPDPTTALLNRLMGQDPTAAAEILRLAPLSTSPTLLGALAAAYLDGDTDRLVVLVREHLSDHPDNLLASLDRRTPRASLDTGRHRIMTTSRTTSSEAMPGRSRAPGTGRPTVHTGATRHTLLRTVGRWLVSFAGFPVGGLLAALTFGPVHTIPAAVAGGAVTGAVIGAGQAWAFGVHRPPTGAWIGATALGLATGLALGASTVGYATDLDALMVQGAFSGAGVGLAQAVVLRRMLGAASLLWPVAVAGLWALGWLVTDAVIGTAVGERFYVFGSSGALVVTALTAALPIALDRRHAPRLPGTSLEEGSPS